MRFWSSPCRDICDTLSFGDILCLRLIFFKKESTITVLELLLTPNLESGGRKQMEHSCTWNLVHFLTLHNCDLQRGWISCCQEKKRHDRINFHVYTFLEYSLKYLVKVKVLLMTVSILIDVDCFIFRVGDLNQKEINGEKPRTLKGLTIRWCVGYKVIFLTK